MSVIGEFEFGDDSDIRSATKDFYENQIEEAKVG